MKLLLSLLAIFVAYISAEPKYMRTPYGLVWSECRYSMESGSHIDTSDDGKTTIHHLDGRVQHISPCPMPLKPMVNDGSKKRQGASDGWQVWSAYNNENNKTFSSFIGNFNVPQAPSNWDGAGVLFMFTGLQNDNWIPTPNSPSNPPPGFDIIQPVLQYGAAANGQGNYWSLASWYVTLDENVFYSNSENVNVGDNIFGNMTMVNATSWYIGSYDVTSDKTVEITINDPRLYTQPWAYCTLEVYTIGDCSGDFPSPSSPLKFTNLELYDNMGKNKVTPTWQLLNNGDQVCGANVASPNPSTVTITF